MKAVVLTADRDVALVEAPDPTPAAGEVVVRPEYCGICGSDLHARDIDVYRSGVVLGHEFAGEIVALGEGVREWSVGERVTANPNGHVCGACRQCRAGRSNLCPVATRERPLGVARDGGLAEYVALHTSYVRRLPEQVDARSGAWVEPLAVALRAVRTSPVKLGDTVAVIGAGPIGLLVVQMLRRAGARGITVVEPSAFRGELALATGADAAVAPEELEGRLDDATVPEVDHVLECSGHPTAVQTAVRMVAPGGSIRLVGMAPRPPSFDSAQAIMKEIRLLGGFIYQEEFEQAIELLASGDVDVGPLTSAVMALEDYQAAFDTLRQPDRAVKVLLEIGHRRGSGSSLPGETAA